MSVQQRKLREKEELRQEILDAARELFATEGYAAVSMRKIADRIEYAPGTIYLHFKDKNELFDCLCHETFAKLIRKLESIDGKGLDPLTSLRKGLRAYVDFGLKNPQHYVLTFMTNDGTQDDPEAQSKKHETGCAAFGCLQLSVEACIEAGHFAEADPSVASQILWAGVHGITSLLIVHPDFPWSKKDELIDGLIDALLKGLEDVNG